MAVLEPELVFCRATDEELIEVCSVLTEAAEWLITQGRALWLPEQFTLGQLQAMAREHEVYLARYQGKAAGVFVIHWEDKLFWPDAPAGEAAYIHKVAVRRQFTGNGIARAMVRWAGQKARLAGRKYLRLDCDSTRPRLRSYYESMGFRLCGETVVKHFQVALYEMNLEEMMFEQILAAKERLKGYAHQTPVMTSQTLNDMLGAEVYFKCENLQKVGAFKFRGAYNSIAKLSQEERARGVLAYSSGNHAQAVALVGKMLNTPTIIVMPEDAPQTKREATAGYGATIISYNPQEQSREEIASELQARNGYTLIPPFDHPDVIAGQGTAALELFENVGELDTLLVPCGGGGLLSGSAIAARGAAPKCRVIGIEPELADDATQSFRSKALQSIKNPPTIADGTRTNSLGNLTFPLILEYVADMQTVSEAKIMDAVQFLFFRMKLVVEPSGALGLAALLSKVVPTQGRIGVILSGGNIDGVTMRMILNQ